MTRHPAPARLVQSEDNRVGAGLLPHTCPQRWMAIGAQS